MWMFVNFIFMVQLTISGSITFSEEPIDTIGILGDEVQLNCSFNNFDRGSESLLWYKERPNGYGISLNTNVYPEGHYLVGEFRTGAYSLRIVNTDVTHEGEYKCKAVSANLTSSAKLILIDKHPTCGVYPGVTVKAGDSTTFNCSVHKAVPPGELIWRMDGDIVSRGGKSSTYSWVTSFDRTNNNANMVCGLEYITLSEPLACKDTIVMDLQYTPEMGVVITGNGSQSGQVIEGDSFLAECSVVDSNPEAENIMWFDADGDVVGTSEWLEFNIVDRIQTDDTYTCMSSVSFYDGSKGNGSTMFTISVQYLSDVNVQYGDNGFAVEDDTFQATCTADANPDPELTWIGRDGKEVGRGYTLTLQDIKPGDSGMYRCHAKVTFWNWSLKMGNASFELDVQYSPSVAVQYSITLIENENITLTCDVIDANPADVSLTWTLVDGTTYNTGMVELSNVKRSLHGSQICNAMNTFYDGTRGHDSGVTHLDIQYFPTIEDSRLTRKEGETATLVCVVDANPDPSTYSWTKDEALVSDQITFSIEDVSRADDGKYICTVTAEFHNGKTGSGQGTTQLFIQYLSTIDMVISPSTLVSEGHDVRIHCLATDGNPNPHVMSLIRDTEEILAEEEGSELQYEIRGINRSHSGVYRCQATTRFYDGIEDVSEEQKNIIVQFSPTIISEETRFEASIGDTVPMSCKVGGFPLSSVSWFAKNDSLILGNEENMNITEKVIDGEIMVTSILTVTVANESFYGTYTCKATNDIEPDGELSFEIVILLKPGSISITITITVTLSVASIASVVGGVKRCRRKGKEGGYERAE